MGAVRILRDKGRNAKTIKMSDCKKGPTGQTKREMAKWSQSCRNGELSDSGPLQLSCPLREVEVCGWLGGVRQWQCRKLPAKIILRVPCERAGYCPGFTFTVTHRQNGASNISLFGSGDAFSSTEPRDSPIAPRPPHPSRSCARRRLGLRSRQGREHALRFLPPQHTRRPAMGNPSPRLNCRHRIAWKIEEAQKRRQR